MGSLGLTVACGDDSGGGGTPSEDAGTGDESDTTSVSDVGTEETESDDESGTDGSDGESDVAASTDEPEPEPVEAGTDLPGPTTGDSEVQLMRFLDELDLGQDRTGWIAEMTRSALEPDQTIRPAGGTSSFEPSDDYHFMYVDREPLSDFQHPTLFAFAAGDEPIVVEDHGWWPLLDDVGLVVTETPLIKLFAPVTDLGREGAAYPGDGGEDYRAQSAEQPIIAFYPDYETDTAEARLALFADAEIASATPAYLNLLVDLDADGVWEPADGERLIENMALSSAAEGWRVSEPIVFPVNDDNKFAGRVWGRISLTKTPIPQDEEDADAFCSDDDDGLSYGCTDEDYDFSTWSGCDSGYGEGIGVSGCTGSITLGPQREEPPIPEIEGGESTFVCQPDGVVIPTLTKALVINVGDNPGYTNLEYSMNKVASLFKLRHGDDAVATMNTPTAERALEAIREMVSGLQCLDEAHLVLIGHGWEGSGDLYVTNGFGNIARADLHAAITGSAEHCPNSLWYQEDGCRRPGYCNLNVHISGCYSGNFLDGDDSLQLPGLNVLTSASSNSQSWGDTQGYETGSRVSHAFVRAFVDNAADAAPYGNEDGVTSTEEAQRFAQAEFDSGPDDRYNSAPQLWQGADCACYCEAEPCGNGVLDIFEFCDPSAPASPMNSCATNFVCNSECGCECGLSAEDCNFGELFDAEACECVSGCGNGLLETGEECDPNQVTSSCSENFDCTDECECVCTLAETDCDETEIFDAEQCACVPIQHCPPVGSFTLQGMFSLFSDPSNHNCCHDVPIGSPVELDFERVDGMFTSPGLPDQDVPPLSGTIENDPMSGCLLEGSGMGTFAGFANSTCTLEGGVLLDGEFTGQLVCTPSGFPDDPPITFTYDAAIPP